jgi:hypothetical protein
VSEGKGHSKDVQNSNIPYLLAIIAIVMTFFDWVGFYSTSNVLGSSASWDTSFNAWWGSYGVVVVIIYALGCFFYSKKYRFYWLAGPLAIVDAFYIYSSIENAQVSYSVDYLGHQASAEAGYELLWGFWAFIAASALFSISPFFLRKNSSSDKSVANKFKNNFKKGWKTLGVATITTIIILSLILSVKESLDGAILIATVFSILYAVITLFVYLFCSSPRMAGYVNLLISALIFFVFVVTANAGASFVSVLIILTTYPVCYIVIDRLLQSKESSEILEPL